MGYLRHVHACNSPVTEAFLPWHIGAPVYGWVRPAFARRLADHSEVFALGDGGIHTPDHLVGERLNVLLQEVASGLVDEGLIPGLMNEPYPITAGGRSEAIGTVDRAMSPYLGLRSFGQHLNGYVLDRGRIMMWLGRRARDRLVFPGALDNMVAGGLPYGVPLQENLLKECHEEAGMPSELARRAVPVGALSYNRVTQRGFRPDILYCYDIELPADFRPRNTDGEVEEFMCLPIEQVMQIVLETDDFKLNCNLVIIDFLIRHGLIGPDSTDYLDLVAGLRTPLGMPEREE